MIKSATIKNVQREEEDEGYSNVYTINIDGTDISCSPISIMGTMSGARAGFIPTYSPNENVLVFIEGDIGYILGSTHSVSGILNRETVLLDSEGAKVHLGDGSGFTEAASGAGSLSLSGKRVVLSVGDVTDFNQHFNREFASADFKGDTKTFMSADPTYSPTYPEEGFYIETDNGDIFHMSSGSITLRSSESTSGTSIVLNADGSIDVNAKGAININSDGNVLFQSGSNSVVADGDSITLGTNGQIQITAASTFSCVGGTLAACPISGAPIPIALLQSPMTNLTANAGTTQLGGTISGQNRKEKVE